jgi:hypothetical protein
MDQSMFALTSWSVERSLGGVEEFGIVTLTLLFSLTTQAAQLFLSEFCIQFNLENYF